MRHTRRMLAVAVASVVAAGCSSTPERIAELEEARQAVTDLRQDPQVEVFARTELREAETALEQAEKAYAEGVDIEIIRHEARVAESYANIGAARLGERAAREGIKDAELDRTRVLEEARAQEAQVARQDAQVARQDAEEARSQADMASERADELQQELADLKAEETDRGLVLTLGDVLFDTGEAALKPGANSTILRLAGFLDEYPKRRLLIEGHTDSRGSDSFNQELSRQRAEAVRMALMQAGVAGERVRAQGLGEQFPVASNDSTAGRQENRRVEIIVSPEDDGNFPSSQDSSARN